MSITVQDAATVVEGFAKDPSRQPLSDSDKIYKMISVLDDLTAELFDVADEYREREQREPKKESDPNPGVEIISKILAAPGNGRLITSMIIGLDKLRLSDRSDPRAEQYLDEYWEKMVARQAAYDREQEAAYNNREKTIQQLLPVPPRPSK